AIPQFLWRWSGRGRSRPSIGIWIFPHDTAVRICTAHLLLESLLLYLKSPLRFHFYFESLPLLFHSPQGYLLLRYPIYSTPPVESFRNQQSQSDHPGNKKRV